MKHLPFSRADRVATEIHNIVAMFCLHRLEDPRLAGIQITKVRVTKDLRMARINYFLRGTDTQRSACQEGLEKSSGLIKRAIAEQMRLKFMPELVFHFDGAIEHGERISELLSQIKER